MRDSFVLDPIDPPGGGAGLDAAELAVWRGHCPWCDQAASFSPSEEFDGSIICRYCGLEFMGPSFPDEELVRAVTAVYAEGDDAKRAASADDLPAVSARP
jgi:hypothetical protein